MNSKVKVFPIPYAGASVNVYYKWKKIMPENYELCLVELAGRGSRFHERFYGSISQAAEDIASSIIAKMTSGDRYVIFGHSMGALLAYEVYYVFKRKGFRLPEHMYFSGRRAPSIERDRFYIDEMDDMEFIDMVDSIGGLPEEFYEKEILDLFLPILRADFTLVDHYVYTTGRKKITCQVSVLYGRRDRLTAEDEILAWKDLCEDVRFYEFEGGHFFINEYPEELVKVIIENE